uniref:Uncharacterized protein n=1 Tax=Utricularia reniformis TaxID=192314 RepID=A0A1Y0B3V4_9LAMI|nr:hypothetical protein AEK19_MT1972 [Utricularia reniformis]ART32135.1 hypothetical protein AEK19_MT1972 [Utricularia reniformis]
MLLGPWSLVYFLNKSKNLLYLDFSKLHGLLSWAELLDVSS